MRRVDRSDDATGTRLHGQGINSTIVGTDTAAKAKLLIDCRLLASGAVSMLGFQRDDLNRADGQTETATTAVGFNPGDEVAAVDRMLMTETLGGEQRLTTTGTAVAEEADFLLHIFTELDQILLPCLV